MAKGMLLFLVLAMAVGAHAESVESIIQKSVRVTRADWEASPEYSCFERDRDPNGQTKTFEDLMIDGSPYQRLVAVNGEPLSIEAREKEQDKFDRVIAERKKESAEARKERIDKYQKDRKRDQLMMQQLTEAFRFSLIGEGKMDSHDVYELKALPRKGYRPPNMDTQVLKGMEGKLWVDKKTYQWVKVEAHVIHPVAIEGFVAQVQPGTNFELEKMPVGDDIWLPKHYSMRSMAKVFFLFDRRSQDDETYYGYRRQAPQKAAGGGI